MVENIDVNKCPECGGYWVVRSKEPEKWSCMYEPCQHKFEGNHLEVDLDVYPIGDEHVGSIGFEAARPSYERFYRNRISNNPKARTIGMGDNIDTIEPSDRRYDVNNIPPNFRTIEQCKKWWIRRIKANRHKTLYRHTGFHEYRMGKGTGDWMESICEQTGVRYGGFLAFATLHFENDKKLKFVTTHGSKALNSIIPRSGKSFRRRQRSIDDRIVTILSELGEGDLILYGHAHRLRVLPPQRSTDPLLKQEGGKLKAT
jgi:hypothetical protein